MCGCPLYPLQLEHALETVETYEEITEIVYSSCQYSACLPLCARPEIIWYGYTVIGGASIAGVGYVLLYRVLVVSLVCE